MNSHTFPKLIIYNCINQIQFSTYNMVALSFSVTGKDHTIQFATSDMFKGIGEA